jgi:hypothetical protein
MSRSHGFDETVSRLRSHGSQGLLRITERPREHVQVAAASA